MFTGSLVPIITPFRDGKLDRDALERVIEYVLREGSDGIIPCGTTGESATLSHEEHERVIEWTIEIVRKRVPVVAGTGSNSTAEAIRLTSAAKRAGADGALLISPYYNKPTQDGIYRHYAAVAEAVAPMPILIYNIPGRTGSKIEPATLARCAQVANIAGVKEATGSLEQAQDVLALCGERFAVYCGEDALNFAMLAVGGHGLISAVGNVIPGALSRMTKLCRDGKWEEARRIHYETLPLVKLLFVETNPIPVKTACSLMGLCTAELRAPMTPMTEGNLAKLRESMRALKMIA
ncbi:MAG: 4-hydroxy-tetrahydrodipicolinate synthase [Candidatus Binatia bacterium]